MGVKVYKYKGVNAEGKKVEGDIEGKDLRHARRQLRRMNIKIKDIQEPSVLDVDLGMLMVDLGLASAFGREELNRFTKQLATLLNAGVPIMDSMEMLAKQEKNPSLKVTIKKICELVGEGKALHEAMSAQDGFDKLYCSLVKAGESAGILDGILEKLSEFMEKQEAIKKKVKSAMTYPSIVLVIGIAVTWGLMVFVVPQFVDILKESNQEIPAVTQFVIDFSNFMQEYTLAMGAILFVAGIIFFKWKKTESGKKIWDRTIMNSPIFGNLIIKGALAGFTRTLSTMLSAGVPLIDSLDICIDTIDNTKIARDILTVRKGVEKGQSITDPLGRIRYFPPLVNQMVKVGESTGNLDQMLLKVSDVFELETEEAVEGMTKLIEPIILVGLGGVIGTVMIAMYLPIFMSAGGA